MLKSVVCMKRRETNANAACMYLYKTLLLSYITKVCLFTQHNSRTTRDNDVTNSLTMVNKPIDNQQVKRQTLYMQHTQTKSEQNVSHDVPSAAGLYLSPR